MQEVEEELLSKLLMPKFDMKASFNGADSNNDSFLALDEVTNVDDTIDKDSKSLQTLGLAVQLVSSLVDTPYVVY